MPPYGTTMKTTDAIQLSASASTALGIIIGDDEEEEEAIVFKKNQSYNNKNDELYCYDTKTTINRKLK